jgi:hypothetical protein
MMRIIAKLVAVVFVAFLQIAPLSAAPVTYIANGGSGSACTSAAPCGSLSNALSVDNGGQVTCLDPNTTSEISTTFSNSVTIDCLGLNLVGPNNEVGLVLAGANQIVKIRNLTMNGVPGGLSAIQVTGGALILENCVFENFSGVALDIEPTGPFNLVIRNSRLSNNASGILLKPGAGGSITATLDHVTITGNNGGGVKVDTTNGPVTTDVTDSVVSDNAGNGINALGNAGGQAVVNIKNGVVAKNGAVGVQANGANAGVLVQMTLFDQNAAGATAAVNGGHISTYGNNSITGSAGSGFTGTASLQ